MNAEYVDETYWFLRNKKGDNISKKLFTFNSQNDCKCHERSKIFSHLDVQFIEELNLTPEFKDYMLLKVGSVSVNQDREDRRVGLRQVELSR